MTKKEDSGKLLLRLFQRDDSKMFNENELLKETRWDEDRLYGALRYLLNEGYIKVRKGSGPTSVRDIIFDRITETGLDIVEHPVLFEKIFGITIQEALKGI